MGRVVNAIPQLLYAWGTGKEVVPILEDSRWALGLVCADMENLPPNPQSSNPGKSSPKLSNYTDYAVPTANRINTLH
jgi:hypothetical protein